METLNKYYWGFFSINLLGQMSSFKFLFFGWLFASQKTGYSPFANAHPLPSLRSVQWTASQGLLSLPRFVNQILEIEPFITWPAVFLWNIQIHFFGLRLIFKEKYISQSSVIIVYFFVGIFFHQTEISFCIFCNHIIPKMNGANIMRMSF